MIGDGSPVKEILPPTIDPRETQHTLVPFQTFWYIHMAHLSKLFYRN